MKSTGNPRGLLPTRPRGGRDRASNQSKLDRVNHHHVISQFAMLPQQKASRIVCNRPHTVRHGNRPRSGRFATPASRKYSISP
jgi:hypothetical protein